MDLCCSGMWIWIESEDGDHSPYFSEQLNETLLFRCRDGQLPLPGVALPLPSCTGIGRLAVSKVSSCSPFGNCLSQVPLLLIPRSSATHKFIPAISLPRCADQHGSLMRPYRIFTRGKSSVPWSKNLCSALIFHSSLQRPVHNNNMLQT